MFDVFYIDAVPGLFPHERRVRDLEHARSLSTTRYLWMVDAGNDYSGFDWTWEPPPWQSQQAHVWPSQHQQNGGTALVPKIAHVDVNRQHPLIKRSCSVPVLGIDHGDGITIPCHSTSRYISDYLGTLRRMLAHVPYQYVWVISSVCDYTTFDFTWHPSEWQQDLFHVFASDDQKFGDTFYVHVPSFLQKSQNLKLLEWLDGINYELSTTVPRKPVPVYQHDHDSHVAPVLGYEFDAPVVQFCCDTPLQTVPAVNLWHRQTKAITPLTKSASRVLVPREAKNSLRSQLYDYDVIDRSHNQIAEDTPLDVVFISNGEHGAEHHYQHLVLALSQHGSRQKNCLHRVDGVQGRVACYQAAARISQTDWFLAVFAKLQVNDDFDWAWQPDRLQQPKHYIFHAYNPVNDLVYGHQAVIAYNRKLVLTNTGHGLDFTLDQPHEVVPMISGTAYYDNDPWTCWRTAFRECIKLRHNLGDIESQYRLQQWLSVGNGANGKWSIAGARDAVGYYDSVDGDFEKLKHTYEWQWLASYAMLLHPVLFTADRT